MIGGQNRVCAFLLGLTATVLSGCAVMRIDVDVYKGPLNNHPDVQRKQLVAMAVGAKPLLIQLRDNLLWAQSGCEGLTGDSAKDDVNELKKWPQGNSARDEQKAGGKEDERSATLGGDKSQSWVVKDPLKDSQAKYPEQRVLMCRAFAAKNNTWYMRDGYASRLPAWANPQASRVNAVLSLYRDLGDPAVGTYLDELERLGDRLRRAYEIFYPNKQEDERLWSELNKGFPTGDQLFRGSVLDREIQKADTALNALKTGHPELQNKRESLNNLNIKAGQAKEQVTDTLNKILREFGDTFRPTGSYRHVDIPELGAQAEALCIALAEDQQKCSDRRKKITAEIAQTEGTDTARVYLFEQFAADERLVPLVETLYQDKTSPQAAQFIRSVKVLGGAAAEVRKATIQLWTRSIEILIALHPPGEPRDLQDAQRESVTHALSATIATLTQPARLAVALRLESVKVKCPEIAQHLNSFAAGVAPVFACNGPRLKWDGPAYSAAERTIRLALVAHPFRTASVLQDLNLTHSNASPEELAAAGEGQTEYGSTTTGWMADPFGIVRSRGRADYRDTAARTGDVIQRSIAATLRAGGTTEGLDSGRPRRGLDFLIDEYLRLVDARERDIGPAQGQLDNALAGFSEKMLMLANSEGLLRAAKDDGGRIEQYVLVLQAIGNAIQVGLDDSAHRYEHDQRQKRRADSERVAIAASRGKSGHDALSELRRDLEVKATNAGERLREVTSEKEAAVADNDAKTATKNSAATAKTTAETNAGTAAAALLDARKAARPVFNALRTLGNERDTGGLGDELAETKELPEVLAGDRLIVKKAAEKLTSVDARTLLAALPTWLTPAGSISCDSAAGAVSAESEDPGNARKLRTGCALSYFTELALRPDTDAAKMPAAAGAQIVVQLAQLAATEYDTKQQPQISQLRQGHAIAEAKAQDARKAFALAEADENAAAKTVTRLTQTEIKATETRNRFKNAYDLVNELLPAVQGQVVTLGGVDAATGFGLMRAAVAKREADLRQNPPAGDTGAAKLKQATDTVVVLNERNSPAPTPAVGTPITLGRDGETTQRDVLDDLIAALRHEHLQAVREGGSVGRASQIESALKFAYEQRAGMTYVRPASAYLRSSYAATSLQNDPRLRWENMLSRHGLRGAPFIGESYTNYGADSAQGEFERMNILTNIDKQFWQNINSVRVAGAGTTNYAIAKDDIGNWYVKAYSADPTQIIKSAQRLALFNLGGSLDSNLLSQLDLQTKIDGGTGTSKDEDKLRELRQKQGPNGDASTLKRVYERYEGEYAQRTERDGAEFAAQIEGEKLQGRLRTAWAVSVEFTEDGDGKKKAAFMSQVEEFLKPESAGPLTDAQTALQAITAQNGADKSAPPIEEKAQSILTALKSINRWQMLLSARVLRLNLNDSEFSVREKAQASGLQDAEVTRRREAWTSANANLESERKALAVLRAGTPERDVQQAKVEEASAQEQRKRGTLDEAERSATSARNVLAQARKDHEAALHARDACARDVADVAGGLVLDFAGRRKLALANLEQAILFVGEAAK